ATLERRVGAVARALVGVHVRPYLDRVVAGSEIVDAGGAPLTRDRGTDAERGVPVHDRAAADRRAREQRDRAVGGRADASVDEQRRVSGELARIERLLEARPRALEDHDAP